MTALRTLAGIGSMVVILAGCALAPGHKMNPERIADDGSFESTQVELIPITPHLIAEDHAGAEPAEIPRALLDYHPGMYHVGPSDVLYITVWDHPELTAPSGTQLRGDANGRTVRPDGTLFYPYVGTVQAAGKTVEELRAEISEKLKTYIESPQVDVGVMQYASQQVTLSGAFEQALPVPVTSRPLTLLEALGAGRVNTLEADLSSVLLTRDGKTYTLDIYALTGEPSAINQVYLKDGDSIHVPFNDNNKVYVMGEVNKPQALAFKSSTINLTDAIGTAGGLEQVSAKGQDVYVIRGVPDLSKEKAKIFQLKAKSPSAFILASKFNLEPQDVVYVGAAGVTRWNRVISQLLPSLSILGLTARSIRDINDLNN